MSVHGNDRSSPVSAALKSTNLTSSAALIENGQVRQRRQKYRLAGQELGHHDRPRSTRSGPFYVDPGRPSDCRVRRRNSAVQLCSLFATSSGLPATTTRPPSSPAPG